jgi:hypothetical protein
MSILKPHSSIIISISDVMVCIESTLTNGKIRAYLGDDMEMACIELTDKFIKTLVNTKFKKSEKKNFGRFLNLTKTPVSIDEGLDLINERGGIEFLSEREVAALDRLTNKSTQ